MPPPTTTMPVTTTALPTTTASPTTTAPPLPTVGYLAIHLDPDDASLKSRTVNPFRHTLSTFRQGLADYNLYDQTSGGHTQNINLVSRYANWSLNTLETDAEFLLSETVAGRMRCIVAADSFALYALKNKKSGHAGHRPIIMSPCARPEKEKVSDSRMHPNNSVTGLLNDAVNTA